jgi:putative phosphoesterase
MLMADIHANYPALKCVLNDMSKYSPDAIVIAGDLLGYYPDANEVVVEIQSLNIPLYMVVGNHDMPIINSDIPNALPYSHILRHNLNNLSKESLDYLSLLKTGLHFEIEGIKIDLYHGTPDDHLDGRLYPDGRIDLSWNDHNADVIILGHTHYPAVWRGLNGFFIINPGSVGQPRDGNPAPSWALLNTETKEILFHRVDYDRTKYAQTLYNINWDERSINALFKTEKGAIRLWG